MSHESKFVTDGNFGYHYPAMWPLLFYTNQGFRYVFEQMELPQFGRINNIDSSGLNNPFIGATTDLRMRAVGDIYRPFGTSTVPSVGGGEYHCIATLDVTNYAVNDYVNGTVKASMAPNIGNRVDASGFSSWPIKMYFARSNTDKTEDVTVGKVVRSDAEYSISLFRR